MLFALCVSLLSAAPVNPRVADAISRAAAQEATEDVRYEVISELDVRRMVEFDSQKQECGADAGTCASELANSFDARVVLFPSLYAVGDRAHVAFTLTDLKTMAVVFRGDAEGADEATLFKAVQDTTRLAVRAFHEHEQGKRTKLFISRAAIDQKVDGKPTSFDPLFIGGAAGAGLGAATAAVGGFLVYSDFATAGTSSKSIEEKNDAASRAPLDEAILGVGAGVAVVGASVALFSILTSE